jgi:hypothetical protein
MDNIEQAAKDLTAISERQKARAEEICRLLDCLPRIEETLEQIRVAIDSYSEVRNG